MTPASLERLVAIAGRAGALILTHAGAATAADLKADRSPVTAADRGAHALINAALVGWDAAVPVISEEGVIPAYDVRRDWPRFWLVDPLDGTKEFLSGTGEYTVNIALVEHFDNRFEPVIGVVHAPALGLTYFAGRGLGSWRQDGDGPPVRLRSAAPSPATPLVVAESRSHPSAELEAYLRTVPVSRRVQAGSSLKFCWVAEGKADLYPRFGPTMEWDTAAGDCVYRQSGTGMERWSPLRYNTPTLRHDHFVIGLPGGPA